MTWRTASTPAAGPFGRAGSSICSIAALAVAVLFTLGLWVNLYDRAESGLRSSGWIDEAAGFAFLVLIAVSALAVRRWRQVAREHHLREDVEARFRALVERSPAITYTWDAQAHRFLYVSPQLERILGYPREEWMAGTWLQAVHPDDRDRLHAAVLASDAGTEPGFSMDYRVVTGDGQLLWVHDETTDIEWAPDGTPAVSLGVLTDITAMREADERAMEVEARYRAMVERVPAVSYVWDAANEPGAASAAYISPQIETLLGYRAEDWLEHPDAWTSFVHPDDVGPVLAAWAEAVDAGAAFAAEYRIRTADDRWLVVRDEANAVGAGAHGRPIYQGVMHDVTARRAAEDALREAEERARSLLENLPVTAYMADYETEEPFTVHDRWIGPGIATLLGISQEAWLNEPDPWIQHVHPADRDEMVALWRTCVDEDRPFVAEYRMVHEDGRTVWVHEEARAAKDGTRMRADGIFADITERKAAEEARLDAETRFQRLVEQLPAVVYLEDAATGVTTYISQHVEQIYGFTPEEWLAEEDMWIRHLHPDDRDRILARDAEDTGDHWTAEYRSIAHDGRVIWLYNHAELVRDDDGTPRYWQGLLFDVTERKGAEDRLVEAQERYRFLVEEIPVVVYTDAVDELSTALYISPGYERIDWLLRGRAHGRPGPVGPDAAPGRSRVGPGGVRAHQPHGGAVRRGVPHPGQGRPDRLAA